MHTKNELKVEDHAQYANRFSFAFSDNPKDKESYYHLRSAVFPEVWKLKHFEGEEDNFDRTGHTLIVKDGERCVAGVVLNLRFPGNTSPLYFEDEHFQVKKLFPELNLDQAIYGELSRFAIAPEYRSGYVALKMVEHALQYASSNGSSYLFLISPKKTARRFKMVCSQLGYHDVTIRKDIIIPDSPKFENIAMQFVFIDLSRFLNQPKKQEVESAPATAPVPSQV